MRSALSKLLCALSFLLILCANSRAADKPAPFELREGDRVVFLGDTFMEREQQFGWIELMLTTRFPDRNLTFRNLGWSADTPAGDSRFGLSLLQAGHEPADEGWNQLVKQLEQAKPTVVFVGYGMASSFDGEAGLQKFKADYHRLLETLEKISPGVRLVLLGPARHQWLTPPFPNPTAHNVQVNAYTEAVREIAGSHKARFISLVAAFKEQSKAAAGSFRWTDDGVHLTSQGYKTVAVKIQDQLGLGANDSSFEWLKDKAEPLRQSILRKNEWFFHRSRPENMAYIFGFRKGDQGQNSVEIPKFDPLIAAEEKRIAQLRSLKRGISVPEIPLRTGNLTAKHTDQPLPSFTVADGLEVTLWAENPLLKKPIQMNFDPQGRLWVASSEVYPQIEPGQAATDKIIVIEDTKGAGRADKATVFAEGLLIPTGVEPGDGGCYVAQSTELLHFGDTDGDGKADVKRTVLSGFGTEDAHHNLHTLRWGFDGRLYMNQSIYTRTDTETPQGVVRLKGGGVFRFDPRDQQLEILFKGWVNAWGHQFDEFGQSFVTDGAGDLGINFGLPGASYSYAPRARRILGSVSPSGYPKFCGLEIIRSQQFPADWQGDLITCDFRAHRIVRFKISEQGAGYVTKEMPDVLRSTADTFRPIDLKLGPDGALYVADWSNPIIQHGEVDFRDSRRDKEHGRIWRITAKDRPLLPKTDLTKLKNQELLDKLISPNSYDQDKARRVLVERGAMKVKKNDPPLFSMETSGRNSSERGGYRGGLPLPFGRGEGRGEGRNREQTIPSPSIAGPHQTGVREPSNSSRLSPHPQSLSPSEGEREAVMHQDEPARLQALWLNEALNPGELNAAGRTLATELLGAKDGRIRAAAVRALANGIETVPNATELLAHFVADEHPRVRLETVRALGRIKSARAAELALTVLDKPMDTFLDYALWLTINELAEPWIAAVKSGAWKPAGREPQFEFALKSIEPALVGEVLGQMLGNQGVPRDGAGAWIEIIGAAGGSKELRQLFDPLVHGEFSEPVALRVFTALSDAARLRNERPDGDLAAFGSLLKSDNQKLRVAALQLAGVWKLAALSPQLVQVGGGAQSSPDERAAALSALRAIGGKNTIKQLQKIVSETQSPEARRAAVVTLASLDFAAALPEITATLKATTKQTDATEFWRELLAIKDAGAKLVEQLPGLGLSPEAALVGARVAREGNRSPGLVQGLLRIAGLTLSDKPLSPAELLALAQEAVAKGDAARGEKIYRRAELACLVCHAIGGAGGKVGPDLTSIGASAQPDYLVESLLYPNAKIKEGFHSTTITTKDDQEFSGIVVKETDSEVIVRNAANQEVSAVKANITQRVNGGSLMPGGLLDALLPEERLDLIKFLSALGKPGDYDAAKGGVARVWSLYDATKPNAHLAMEDVIRGDFKQGGWTKVFTLVNGGLSRDICDVAMPSRGGDGDIFATTQFQSANGGAAKFTLAGETKAAWLNGVAVQAGAQFSGALKPGVNTLVLQLDGANLPDALSLSSDDVTFLTN